MLRDVDCNPSERGSGGVSAADSSAGSALGPLPTDIGRPAVALALLLLSVFVLASLTLTATKPATASEPAQTSAATAAQTASASATATSERTMIGTFWSVSQPTGSSSRTIYWFHDPEPFDLFRYHELDSNKDGIANVRLAHDERCLILRSQCYPNHPTAVFPNDSNPNSIQVQDLTIRIPLRPKRAAQITRLPMGPIAVALNGVVFFNPFEAGGMNAIEGYSAVWLDSCCGHPQQHGVYHYHKFPTCLKSPFPDDGTRHSPVIGFAFDGFPIYGPYEADGLLARDLQGDRALDVCNGHDDPVRGYHYHVTPGRFPYVIGGYRGEVEVSNSRHLRRPEVGAIENNAQGETRRRDAIAAVRPGTIVRGQKHRVAIELTELPGLPLVAPEWVQFGPYEALKITRNGRVVTVEIDVPADASANVLLDCHMEFVTGAAGPRRVFLETDALRVSLAN